MKLAILSALVSCAAAFTGVAPAKSSTALEASKYAQELGAQVPLGYWDPLRVLSHVDNDEKFNFFREAEITHGRVAMLAMLGQLTVRAGFHFSGDFEGVAYADIPPGLAAFDVMPFGLKADIFATMAFLQCGVRNIEGTGNEFPGDYRNGWIDFGWDNFSDAEKLKKRAIELNNGRAAMM
eukprot:11206550-Ditylum_brightwellii.AAC.1